MFLRHKWRIANQGSWRSRLDNIHRPNIRYHKSGQTYSRQWASWWISPNISSSREELQGITAFSIITRLLLHFHSTSRSLETICGNQGIINQCSTLNFSLLHSQREPNIDLFLTQCVTSRSLPNTYCWVKGHHDKEKWETITDLEKQDLSRDEISNIWYNQQANTEVKTRRCTKWNTGSKPQLNDGLLSLHIQLLTNSLVT